MSPATNADDSGNCLSPVTDSTVEGPISPALRVCCFRIDPCSTTGKRAYLLQMIILPFIPIAALIVQNCCTMVSVTIANRDAMEMNKQVNVCQVTQNKNDLKTGVTYLKVKHWFY
jgi:hypothetical protein